MLYLSINRLFLALKAQLYDYDKIKSDFSEVIEGRWIGRDNLHMTVAYFGDRYSVEELLEKLPFLIEPIEELKLDSIGYFKRNKILYAGAESLNLNRISSKIEDELFLNQSKPFVAHTTVMRVKNIKDENGFRNLLSSYRTIELGIVEPVFELINSQIEHPGGARYEILKRF